MKNNKKIIPIFLFLINFVFLFSIAEVSILLAICICLVIFALYLIYRKIKNSNDKKRLNANKNVFNAESYAKMCNAYIEHEEEMKDYEKYYNINDESTD